MEANAYTMGFFLSRASLAMRQHVNRLLKDSDAGHVSMGFIGVLLSLYRKDGQTISELGEAVSLEKSTMTGLIERMVNSGLVTRDSDPDDGRVSRVFLTGEGNKARSEIERVLDETYAELTRGVAEKEIVGMQKLLEKMIDNARSQG